MINKKSDLPEKIPKGRKSG